MLSARAPIDKVIKGREWTNLQWYIEDCRVDEIIDPGLKDEILPDCLKGYVDMAYKCTN